MQNFYDELINSKEDSNWAAEIANASMDTLKKLESITTDWEIWPELAA